MYIQLYASLARKSRGGACPVRQIIGHVDRLEDTFVVYY